MASSPSGVCLLYMGGPETLAEVRPFLLRLFSDRDLIRLPIPATFQPLFAEIISRLRAPRVKKRYALIGGGSPLNRMVQRQAALLEEELSKHGNFKVQIALRYTRPRSDEAVAALKAASIEHLFALPLYPHFSSATTGSSQSDLRQQLKAQKLTCPTCFIDSFYRHPLYIEALASTVSEALAKINSEPHVVFSAHGLPKRLVDGGDPYQTQVEATVEQVVQKLALKHWTLGYQSRTGPVRWIGPDVLDVISHLAKSGVKHLVIVPVSFVSDHIETLYELDVEMKAFAMQKGIRTFVRAPALNDHRLFITALAELILSAA